MRKLTVIPSALFFVLGSILARYNHEWSLIYRPWMEAITVALFCLVFIWPLVRYVGSKIGLWKF